MTALRFRDKFLDNLYQNTIGKIEDHHEGMLANADELRWSENPKDRVTAAIVYAAYAVFLSEKEQSGKAAEYFHFSGHAFRSVWMEAKAAQLYMMSAEAGEAFLGKTEGEIETSRLIAQIQFDLRSIGRAVHLFRVSGQREKSNDAKKHYSNRLRRLYLMQRRYLSYIASFFLD